MADNKYNIPEGTRKIRTGNYVIYNIDYLLDNLAREVSLLEDYRNWKRQKCKEDLDDAILFGKGCIKCPSHNKCMDAFQTHSHLCNHYDKTREEFAKWSEEQKREGQ